jgi:acetylornithine deacetylase/succinyl-diaminopimelate desuccinylase-like protein
MPLFSLADFERDALPALMEFATVPSLSPEFDTEWAEHGHLDEAARLLAEWAKARIFAGVDVTIHRLEGRTPTLVVTIDSTAGAGGTVVLYGHLDKQPPLGDWSEGLEPYAPVRRGDRIFARGVSDDGYAIFSALSAIETMEAKGIAHARCVVLIEASEESGSPDLEAYLDLLADHLGDVELLICLDSGALTYDRLWVTTSLRGLVNVELTVKVLEHSQHSGSASGVVPSSFRLLRQLLDRVEDATTGRVLVESMHVTIPDAETKSAHDLTEEFGDVMAKELPTVAGLDLMGKSGEDRLLQRAWHPTLSIIGMSGIPQPEIAGNVLRAYTTAILSFRLPPTADPATAGEEVVRLLRADPPSNAQVVAEVRSDSKGWATPAFAPWLATALEEASIDAFGRPVGYMGEGGSIPFLASLGTRYPGVQFVATGVGGPQSNAHAIDEMLDLPTAVGITNAVITVLGAHAKQ